MKTVTVEQALTFCLCYPEEKIRAIAGDKQEWTALDVLRLTNVPAKDRRYAVLRPEFLESNIMHEVVCQYVEDAFTYIEAPDPGSIAAIETRRRWIRGEATDDELKAARRIAIDAANAAADAARDAEYAAAYAAEAAAYAAVYATIDAAEAAIHVAIYAANAVADAAWDAVDTASCGDADAVADAADDAADAAIDAVYERQVEMLVKLLEETV